MAATRLWLVLPFVAAFAAPAPTQHVEWFRKDFSAALAAAKESKAEMVLLYCWEMNHPTCQAMFNGTMADEKVPPVLNEFLCMGSDRMTDEGRKLHRQLHIEQVPTILFLQPDGAVVDAIVGYLTVADFLAEIERIKQGEETLAALRDTAAAATDDLAAQLDYVRKLRSTGNKAESLKVIDAIIQKDPKFKKPAAAEAMMLKLTDEVFPPDTSPHSWDYEPLYAFLRKQKSKHVLFLGYNRLAEAARVQENFKDWAKFTDRAWKNIPAEEVPQWGQDYARVACDNAEELDKINKAILKRTLKVSEKALKAVEKKQKKEPDMPFMAWAKFVHSRVLKANNKRKDALKLLDEAIAMDPANEGYKETKKAWVAGR